MRKIPEVPKEERTRLQEGVEYVKDYQGKSKSQIKVSEVITFIGIVIILLTFGFLFLYGKFNN
jgi:hypothetical protein